MKKVTQEYEYLGKKPSEMRGPSGQRYVMKPGRNLVVSLQIDVDFFNDHLYDEESCPEGWLLLSDRVTEVKSPVRKTTKKKKTKKTE